MRRATPQTLLAVVAALALTASWACSNAGEQGEESELATVVVTQWNDSTELFLEYPHPVAGQATGNWAIHMSSMKDFQPIRSGMLTVRFMTDQGIAETFALAAPARDGIFLLDPVISSPGTYRVELELRSPQVTSRHVLSDVLVFRDLSDVPQAADEEGGGIAFLKEQQWQSPFEVRPAEVHELQRTVAAPAEIVAPDGALVEVSAPVDGIASAAENRRAPSVGQRVQPGQVLAVLEPTTQEGGFAQAWGRVERLEREVARAERLYAAGAIAQKRLEETRHDLEIARAEAEAMGADSAGADYLLRLTSPITGVVARRSFVPGGRVRAGEPLFTIVDPSTAWLRAQVPAAVAAALAVNAPATFTVEGSDQVHTASPPISVGNVLNPETRTVPVVFQIAGSGSRFTFGQLAQAAIPAGGTVQGVAIPNRAIVDDNGTPVAYVQVGGEAFERRMLTLGTTDGTRTQVVAGIQPGDRVVVTGAYQVRLASMSGGEFAAGHVH